MTFAESLDENYQAVNPKTQFKTTDTIYVSVAVAGRPTTGTLNGKFFYGNQLIWEGIFDFSTINKGVILSIEEDTFVGLHVTLTQPWPVDTGYRFELTISQIGLGSSNCEPGNKSQRFSLTDPLVLPVRELLDMAFGSSAQVSGFGDSIGEFKENKLADIALIRQDGLQNCPCFNPAVNLVYSMQSSQFDTVICNGKVLMQNRLLKAINKEKIKQEIFKRLGRMTQRVTNKRIDFYPG